MKGRTADDYKKMDHLTHIKKISDTYIGSCDQLPTKEWVLDLATLILVLRDHTMSEGIRRLFLELLSNAGDNVATSRKFGFDPKSIDVSMSRSRITVKNYGHPIPVEMHPDENIMVPELIFGHLLTSTNYAEDEVRLGAGRNGYGAKLVSAYSDYFMVDIRDHIRKKRYRQVWRQGMTVCEKAKIEDYDGEESSTSVTYDLNFEAFKMTEYPDVMFEIIAKYTMDYSLSCQIPTRFLDKRIDPPTWQTFTATIDSVGKMFFGDSMQSAILHNSWCGVIQEDKTKKTLSPPRQDKDLPTIEMAIVSTPYEGQQISFVNGLQVAEGGVHVDVAYKEISKYVLDSINAEFNGKKMLSTADIKNHVSIIMNCRLPNPKFKSQTKTILSSPTPNLSIPESVLKPIKEWDLVKNLEELLKQKQNAKLKQTDGAKKRHVNIPDLEDANDAGGPKSLDCILCIVEGKSAMGYGRVMQSILPNGMNRIGLFPIRGKMLNVRKASLAQIIRNKEITNLKLALGLKEEVDYSKDEEFKKLRYGKVVIQADADKDGTHIRMLIANWLHNRFPSLIARGFVTFYRTPILRVWKGKDRFKCTPGKNLFKFYTQAEYETWRRTHTDWQNWEHMYYKGLATSEKPDVRDDCQDPKFVKMLDDDQTLDKLMLAFDKDLVNARKDWLKTWAPDLEVPNASEVTIADCVDKELIHFSMESVHRGIPNFIDGLKQSHRQILFAVMSKWKSADSGKQVRVSQLTAAVMEMCNYHYGDASLNTSIVGMTQDFVGANNLRFFEQRGMFGTRAAGGQDAGAPRYVNVYPERWIRLVFKDEDDALLHYVKDEGPDYYLPIIPLWAINGASGIGTGYSTFFPNHSPLDVCKWFMARLEQETDNTKTLPNLKPWYRGFKGEISLKQNDKKKKVEPKVVEVVAEDNEDQELEEEPQQIDYEPLIVNEAYDDPNLPMKEDEEHVGLTMVTKGTYEAQLHKGITITELPVGCWTKTYIKWLESLMNPKKDDETKKKQERKITKIANLSNEDTGTIKIQVSGFSDPSIKSLRLTRSYGLTNLVLLNEERKPEKQATITDWLERFYQFRYPFYEKRKLLLLRDLEKKIAHHEAKQKFLRAVTGPKKQIDLTNKKEIIIAKCQELGLDTDFLKLSIVNISADEVDELAQSILKLKDKYTEMENLTGADLWKADLEEFVAVYKKTIGHPK